MQSQSQCVLVDHYLSPRVPGEVPELLSEARQVVHPKESLLLGVILVPCNKDVIHHSCPSLSPVWLQGDCRENSVKQRQIQNGGEMLSFSCF
jgi:hypothetical protein